MIPQTAQVRRFVSAPYLRTTLGFLSFFFSGSAWKLFYDKVKLPRHLPGLLKTTLAVNLVNLSFLDVDRYSLLSPGIRELNSSQCSISLNFIFLL